MEAESQAELCLADRGRCREQEAGTGRYWTEADGSWECGRDWRGRNIGNGSIGVSKGKVFYREWSNLGVEWSFWRVEWRRLKVESDTADEDLRKQVDRLLNPECDITLSSLQRAAAMLGRWVVIELV